MSCHVRQRLGWLNPVGIGAAWKDKKNRRGDGSPTPGRNYLPSSRDRRVQHVSPASVEAETSLAAGRGFSSSSQFPSSIGESVPALAPAWKTEHPRDPERGDVIPKSEPGHIRDAAPVEKQLSPFQAPVGAGERFNAGVCGDGLMDHQSRGTWSFLGSCDRCSCDA